ncbi:MAG: hypothetical protein ACTXOO_02045 [Sodalis sp. (in: enterobacteria)]
MTKLPMCVDLLDHASKVLKQFCVIAFNAYRQIENTMTNFGKVTLAPQFASLALTSVDFDWRVNWLPSGVTEASRSRRASPGINKPIENRMYSARSFRFSINVGQGRLTISSRISALIGVSFMPNSAVSGKLP